MTIDARPATAWRLAHSSTQPSTESVCGYVADMLMELATLAARIGEPGLCASIETSALLAGKINHRRQARAPMIEGDAE